MRLPRRLTDFGISPSDSDELRVRKRLLRLVTIITGGCGLIWGACYWRFGEPTAAALPVGYTAMVALGLVAFGLTKSYALLRIVHLGAVMVVPIGLHIVLGGFANSSAVVIWSVLAPVGAIVFARPREAIIWGVLDLLAIVGVAVTDAAVRTPPTLPQGLVTTFFALNIGLVAVVPFVMMLTFVRQRAHALRLLQEEQAKSEKLLLNVLPRDIAAILRDESRTIADHHEGVSILFADVCGFTSMAARMSADDVVGLLNEIFTHFDELAERYGVEKIKTIGDCYMVASGIPRARDDHAQVLARMALEMREFVESRSFRGQRVTFRIGINSGSVVAGVIGRHRFIYDLWGDAVNTASRMESQGSEGQIQITRATRDLLGDAFVCEPRGTVGVKGKGEMEVWHVIGEAGALRQGGERRVG